MTLPQIPSRSPSGRRPVRRTGTVLLLALVACSADSGTNPAPPPPPPPSPPAGDLSLAVDAVVTGLSRPLYLTSPPGDDRLFIVEQTGRIRVFRGGSLLGEPFLDLVGKVSNGNEQGLLSMAFHPDYASNGIFFVSYTDEGGDTRIERYAVSSDPDRAEIASAKLILEVSQPRSNHNGGHILFGPDGMLYVALGDGGGTGDPLGNGQNAGTLLGSLLRLDVDGGDPYAIPDENPFGDEIWATGLRNPWRIAFDPPAGKLYIADVGQNDFEEINVVDAGDAGLNYGWNILEGAECFGSTGCDRSGLLLPALVYDHGEGCSVTGGFAYRGSELTELAGHYFFSDFCAGFLRSFRFDGSTVTELTEWDVGNLGSVTSFGLDAAGELYLLTNDGRVLRLIRGP